MSKYDVDLSIEAQKKYCQENESPHFASVSGRCYRCGKNIYDKQVQTDLFLGEEKERITGITVERASNDVITGCPHCNYSFIS